MRLQAPRLHAIRLQAIRLHLSSRQSLRQRGFLRVGIEELGGSASTNPESTAAGGHQSFQRRPVMLRRGANHCAQAGDGIVGMAELQQTVREVELRAEVARLDRQYLPKALDRAL